MTNQTNEKITFSLVYSALYFQPKNKLKLHHFHKEENNFYNIREIMKLILGRVIKNL